MPRIKEEHETKDMLLATPVLRRTGRLTNNPYRTPNAKPTPYRSTRTAEIGDGVIKVNALEQTPLMTTRLRAGVGLEAIPSPTRLKLKSALEYKETMVEAKQNISMDSLSNSLEELALDTTRARTQKTTHARKGKGKAENVETPAADKKNGVTDDSAAFVVTTKQPKRLTQTKSHATGFKRTVSGIYHYEEEQTPFDLNPVVPLSLQQNTSSTQRFMSVGPRDTYDSKSAPVEAPVISSDIQEKVRNLVIRFQQKAVASSRLKQLWDIEEEDLEKLQDEIEHLKAENGGEAISMALTILQGMLEVSTRFQKFRGSFDRFLDDADKVGMGLDWDEKDTESDVEADDIVEDEEAVDL